MCGAIELDPGDKYSVSIVASFEGVKGQWMAED
jgi:hypothetical protein